MQKKNKADVQPILDPKSLVNEGFIISYGKRDLSFSKNQDMFISRDLKESQLCF